jgi:hypothetical protein
MIEIEMHDTLLIFITFSAGCYSRPAQCNKGTRMSESLSGDLNRAMFDIGFTNPSADPRQGDRHKEMTEDGRSHLGSAVAPSAVAVVLLYHRFLVLTSTC